MLMWGAPEEQSRACRSHCAQPAGLGTARSLCEDVTGSQEERRACPPVRRSSRAGAVVGGTACSCSMMRAAVPAQDGVSPTGLIGTSTAAQHPPELGAVLARPWVPPLCLQPSHSHPATRLSWRGAGAGAPTASTGAGNSAVKLGFQTKENKCCISQSMRTQRGRNELNALLQCTRL